MTPPYPVVVSFGFKYFALPNGRQSAAVVIDNQRIYARDYPVGSVVEDKPAEPDDMMWLAMMSSEK